MKKDQDVQRGKTVWDWLPLLIQLLGALGALAIPVAIAIGTTRFSYQQSQTSMQIADDQQREAALQAYLGQMSDLLLVDNLRKSKSGDEVRQVARARTLTVLRSLDRTRKGYLLQFLYEANLISNNDVIVDLSDADLSDADLRFTTLSDADLSGANLSGATLSGADLSGANLFGATLSGADLSGATLSGANLIQATLSGADFSFADLSGVDLRGADLREANLCHAKEVTQEQLRSALSLKGATMPNCTKNP